MRFNSQDWIDRYCGEKFVDQDIEDVKNFLVIWNIFERKLFNKRLGIVGVDHNYRKFAVTIPVNVTNLTFDYLIKRYAEDNDISTSLTRLKIENSISNKIRNIMENQHDVNIEDKTFFILHIIRRLRNNLFHGEKNIRYIYNQNELFACANMYVTSCIENGPNITNRKY